MTTRTGRGFEPKSRRDLRSLFLIRVLPADFEDSEMPKKAMPTTGIPEGFALTEKTIAFVSERFPTVNIEGTLERFTESALAHGRMYADWQAAFRTWVRKAVENKWDGVEYKQGRAQDPRWVPVLSEAHQYGFREPQPQETPDSYRTQLNRWKSLPSAVSKVVRIGDAFKVMK